MVSLNSSIAAVMNDIPLISQNSNNEISSIDQNVFDDYEMQRKIYLTHLRKFEHD